MEPCITLLWIQGDGTYGTISQARKAMIKENRDGTKVPSSKVPRGGTKVLILQTTFLNLEI